MLVGDVSNNCTSVSLESIIGGNNVTKFHKGRCGSNQKLRLSDILKPVRNLRDRKPAVYVR
jgi:hypothetical protein